MPWTLPFSKNNPIKVTLTNGGTVIAKITRVNEETGKVSWIDLARKWKGATHIIRAVRATPEEIIAYQKGIEASKPPVAPLDPCMVGWSLGKTKRGPQMMEGYYFAISVYYQNKKVGEIVDAGDGGPTMTQHFKDRAVERLFNEACTTWAKNNGCDRQYVEAASEFWQWWDEDRVAGKDAKTYFKEQKEKFEKMFGKQTPIHTGNLAFVQGNI